MVKRIEISPWACFQWALGLLILPLSWILAFVFAAAVHELGHILMLKVLGVRIDGISGDSRGLRICTEPMPVWKELLSALAGPGASFILLWLIRWYPMTALCGLVQGLYNLLPVMPFDGGRALRCLMELFCPGAVVAGMEIAKWLTALLVIGLGIWTMIQLKSGLLPLLVALFLLSKVLPRKRPCKEDRKGVQ